MLAFSAVTIVLGLGYLALTVNWLTAVLGLITWFIYVWIYTPLKSITSANTAVGAVAGALPVLMGWAAVGSELGLKAFTLFLIVFLWQFPHFMAIAWIYRHQYAAAGLQMLPVVDPSGRRAGAQAVVSALALVPVSLIPAVLRSGRRSVLRLGPAVGLGTAGLCRGVFAEAGRDFRSPAVAGVAGVSAGGHAVVDTKPAGLIDRAGCRLGC